MVGAPAPDAGPLGNGVTYFDTEFHRVHTEFRREKMLVPEANAEESRTNARSCKPAVKRCRSPRQQPNSGAMNLSLCNSVPPLWNSVLNKNCPPRKAPPGKPPHTLSAPNSGR